MKRVELPEEYGFESLDEMRSFKEKINGMKGIVYFGGSIYYEPTNELKTDAIHRFLYSRGFYNPNQPEIGFIDEKKRYLVVYSGIIKRIDEEHDANIGSSIDGIISSF